MKIAGQKILMTGGGGFVGRVLLKKLIEEGVSPKDIYSPDEKECDLRVFENCKKATEGRDLVIHLAAVTGGIEFHKNNPARILSDNVAINRNIIEASRLSGVKKFLSVGSAALYDGGELPYKEELLDNWICAVDDLHAPYNYSKYLLFLATRFYRKQYGFNAIHLVFTNVYGPGDDGKTGYFIPSLIERVLKAKKDGLDLEVWGTGRATRDFVYVEDVADAIIKALKLYDESEPINIGTGKERSIKEITKMVADAAEFKGKIKWLTDKPEGQMRRVLDTNRAKKFLKFSAKMPMKKGIEKTLNWFVKNKK